MSLSSLGTKSPPFSSVSMRTPQVESDNESYMSKNAMTFASNRVDKARTPKRCEFLPNFLQDLVTPRSQQKMKSYPDKPITSTLSPFAKIFVPRINLLTSVSSSIAGHNETISEKL